MEDRRGLSGVGARCKQLAFEVTECDRSVHRVSLQLARGAWLGQVWIKLADWSRYFPRGLFRGRIMKVWRVVTASCATSNEGRIESR